MIQVIKPAVPAEVVYIDDLTGKESSSAACKISFSFNTPNYHDDSLLAGAGYTFHTNHELASKIIKYIISLAKKNSPAPQILKKELEDLNDQYVEAINSRSYSECDAVYGQRELIKMMVKEFAKK